jgi:hypothetical protein
MSSFASATASTWALGQALPGDVGSDQRGVDMDDLALRNAGNASLHGALENATEPLGAPALPYPRQRGMIGQSFLQAIPGEPADREVDLRLAHEPPVVDDTEQETRQHQPDRRLRIDPRPSLGGVEFGNFRMQPLEVEHTIDPRKNMVVRNQIADRAADEELQLSARLSFMILSNGLLVRIFSQWLSGKL